MSKLLVIIVTYNGMEWLDRCLSSVRESSIKSDIFIVDNGSTDGTIDYIKTNYPDVKLIIAKENLGFGKANNIGFKYALDNDYDYVYLLNQDAWVEPNVFEMLIEIQKQNSGYGILSPLQVNSEKTRLDKIFELYCPDALLSDLQGRQNIASLYTTSFVMAAHWLISRECLETVGFFSPSFYHYGEDNNFVDRATYFKQKTGIVPLCRGVHDRENRPIPKQKKQYIFHTGSIILLSNPNLKKRYLRLVYRYLKELFKTPDSVNIKYIIETVRRFKELKKNRELGKSKGAFIN